MALANIQSKKRDLRGRKTKNLGSADKGWPLLGQNRGMGSVLVVGGLW